MLGQKLKLLALVLLCAVGAGEHPRLSFGETRLEVAIIDYSSFRVAIGHDLRPTITNLQQLDNDVHRNEKIELLFPLSVTTKWFAVSMELPSVSTVFCSTSRCVVSRWEEKARTAFGRFSKPQLYEKNIYCSGNSQVDHIHSAESP